MKEWNDKVIAGKVPIPRARALAGGRAGPTPIRSSSRSIFTR
jgi:hypothetical protein